LSLSTLLTNIALDCLCVNKWIVQQMQRLRERPMQNSAKVSLNGLTLFLGDGYSGVQAKIFSLGAKLK